MKMRMLQNNKFRSLESRLEAESWKAGQIPNDNDKNMKRFKPVLNLLTFRHLYLFVISDSRFGFNHPVLV